MAKMVRTRHKGVYRRGSRYVAVFMVDGRQRKESAATLKEAKALKDARTTDARRGEFHEQARVSFAEYAAEWVERYRGMGRGFRESTRDDYRRDLKRYVCRYFGNRRLSQIQPRDVARFVAWLCDESEQGQHLADATVRRIVSPLRACMRTAVQEGLIRSNPTRDVALPNREKVDEDDEEEQVRVFSRAQLAALLGLFPPKHRHMFRFLTATGLRISELIALQWRHLRIDQDQPHVRVRRQLYRERIQPPKSKYGRRNVPLDPRMASELRKLRMATNPADDDLVFSSGVGTPLRPNNLHRRVLTPVAEKVGAPWASFHTFRHTCASMLFAQGRSVVQVQRWLGHHSATFTLATYVHLLPGEVVEPLTLEHELPFQQGPEVATEMAMDPTDTGVSEEELRVPVLAS
jgi:integrase